jgi:DNA-binding response OmpR family regulator
MYEDELECGLLKQSGIECRDSSRKVDKPRILLIDDSDLTLEGLKIYLSPKFEVITACDGFSALREYEKSFDLIITDLLIPAISGFGLISSLRQQHPKTPILAMTGWGQPPQWDKLKADILLMKPFELEELDRSMNKLLVHRIR